MSSEEPRLHYTDAIFDNLTQAEGVNHLRAVEFAYHAHANFHDVKSADTSRAPKSIDDDYFYVPIEWTDPDQPHETLTSFEFYKGTAEKHMPPLASYYPVVVEDFLPKSETKIDGNLLRTERQLCPVTISDVESLLSKLGQERQQQVDDNNASESTEKSTDDVLNEDEKIAMLTALDRLGDRERRIVELRFGIADGKTYTLQAIALDYGVSRERIRQIERFAIKQLQFQTIANSHTIH
jgi:RNA polymerase sigma factor (sigma-70 family)